MKPIRLLIAAGVLALLGGAIWYSDKHPPKDSSAVESKPAVKMVSVKEDQVTKIHITHPPDGASLTVEKNSRGQWNITEPAAYAADESSVKSLISALASLEADQVVNEKNTDWQTYGLDPGKLKVEAVAGGKPLEVTIGDAAPTGTPVYARVSGDARLFGVSPSVKGNLDKGAADLRDKRLLRVEADKVSKVTLVNRQNPAGKELEFSRNGTEWQFVKPRVVRADNYMVDDLIRAGAANYETSIAEDEKEMKKYDFSKPFAVLEVVDQTGVHKLTVIEQSDKPKPEKGKKAAAPVAGADLFYLAKTTEMPGVFRLANGGSNSLGKGIVGYRNGKIFELNFSDPDKIEMRDGDLRVTIEKKFDKDKKEDQWFNGKKLIASEKVQSLLSQIRRLNAKEYPSDDAKDQAKYGLDKPTVEVKVTLAGKAQHAVFSSQGQGNQAMAYAARDNDGTTYQFDYLDLVDLKKVIGDVK